jgi:hypothetical protein
MCSQLDQQAVHTIYTNQNLVFLYFTYQNNLILLCFQLDQQAGHTIYQSELSIFNDSPIRTIFFAVFPTGPIDRPHYQNLALLMIHTLIRNNLILMCFQLDQQAGHTISTNQNLVFLMIRQSETSLFCCFSNWTNRQATLLSPIRIEYFNNSAIRTKLFCCVSN